MATRHSTNCNATRVTNSLFAFQLTSLTLLGHIGEVKFLRFLLKSNSTLLALSWERREKPEKISPLITKNRFTISFRRLEVSGCLNTQQSERVLNPPISAPFVDVSAASTEKFKFSMCFSLPQNDTKLFFLDFSHFPSAEQRREFLQDLKMSNDFPKPRPHSLVCQIKLFLLLGAKCVCVSKF